MKRSFLLLFLALVSVSMFAEEEAEKPKAYLVSNAHLDTQWNWDLQTTIKEYVWNTLNQNLILLDKYPNYIFNFEGGVKYSWMKEYYPREFERLKRYVSDGRWHLSGSSWDANDVIVPSIESNIRNILLGQTFYRDEFGEESTDIFLPDCFGFGWTLPTVASHCGLIGFSSQKLAWRINPFYGDQRVPFTIGLWEGVDGSKIMMAHGFDYGRRWNDEDLTENTMLRERSSESPLNINYSYYGTGDIGGSPTITSVHAVDRAHDTEGDIKVISAESDRMYKDFLPYDQHPELPEFNGELTMDVHGTGCYTSQAAMKLYNRQNEVLGDAAERSAMGAELVGAAEYPSEFISNAWRRFIFHQFHDDLTGTSIPRAYEFSWNDELLSLKQFADVVENSTREIAANLDTRTKGKPIVLYNALGFDVTDIVPVKEGDEVTYIEASVPANGFSVLDFNPKGKKKALTPYKANELENSLYYIKFDDKGDINSLIIKSDGKDLVKKGHAIRLAMFEENESFNWPAWEILKETVDITPVSFGEGAKMTIVEQSPLKTTLCIEKEYDGSVFRQYVSLYEGALADRIDFYNEIDWGLTNRLLKAEFPMSIENAVATYDLGIGTIERGNNVPTAYEVYAQRWADLTDNSGDYGLTVINDSKYGWDKPDDNILRLTLLHTPKTKDRYTYQDRQDNGFHTFTYSLIPHKGPLDKSKASRSADMLSQRVKAFETTKHPGSLGKKFSVARIDNPNVTIKALKKAESTDEYVVRIYETSGTGNQTATIEFPYAISKASEANGTEKTIGMAEFSGNRLNVEVGKNGIKTYKVKFAGQPAPRKKDYAVIPLNYDKRCFSWNGFEGDADFSEGFSYAAELIPESLTIHDVAFSLENKALLNGKICRGDTLKLPEGDFNQLHILASSASELMPAEGKFKVGKKTVGLTVPSYTGFIGQWGHNNHTDGYLKEEEVAYVGTHRHSPDGDIPYEFTYMFKYVIDIPKGAKEIVLPDNSDLILFAATAVNDISAPVKSASRLFRTSNKENTCKTTDTRGKSPQKQNLLEASMITGWSGFVGESECPALLNDGDTSTKWCDPSSIPSYVTYDLGKTQPISEWMLVNAGGENPSYITSTCLLQGRNSPDEEWQTLDALLSNKRNNVRRKLVEPVEVRFLKLEVVQPEQSPDGPATRIYEFEVY